MEYDITHSSVTDQHVLGFRPRKSVPSAGRAVERTRPVDAARFLRSAGLGKTTTSYRRAEVVFSQGDASDSVFYIQQGAVKLSVRSCSGKEAVVAMLGPGDFFGESSLGGHPVRQEAAVAMTPTTLMKIPKERMTRLLHAQPTFSDRFITHMLVRNIRIEEDLVDQLFNSSEKRLARALILLAHFDQPAESQMPPRISQQTLAEMIGTTRSRVNFFMNKFKKLGFIEYGSAIKINHSLLAVVLQNEHIESRAARSS